MRGASHYKPAIKRYSMALFFVALAMIVRDVLLDSLGGRLTWLTFYPAVMAAAMFGGFWAGMLASGAACFGAVYMWEIYSHQPFIKDSGDWLGLGVFLMNGAMISVMAEAARRSKDRAEKAREEAENANRAKSVFLATMSHELRTPLNAILGFSELMRHDEVLTDEHRDAFKIINKSGTHLLRLINDVLDMARVEAGKLSLVKAPCSILALVNDLTDLMRQRAAAKGLTLELEFSPDVPGFVSIDEAKVRQVLINLMGNAIKFTSSGKICLRVNYAIQDSRTMLLFEIEDTGVGISESDIGTIFQPFVQAGQSRATREGTGLGLAISHQFTEVMNGVLAVSSTPGVGSMFRFEVPAEPVAGQVDQEEVLPRNILGIEPGQKEWRILIVEDEPANWMLLKRILEKTGLDVRVAVNGQDGVAVFQEWHPHFIWMDCRMPVMDGLEATRVIRTLDGGDSVKIVALTASVFKEERDSIMSAGMDGFMQKPIDFNAIYTCMEEQLGIKYIRDIPGATTPPDAIPEIDTDAQRSAHGQQVENPAGAIKILAVDDTSQSLKLLESILTREGYHIRLADSGKQALEYLQNFSPDLILLDINMPGMNGFDVCRQLKSDPVLSEIPVIFLSAAEETAMQIEGFNCGAVDFVTKPFETEILLTRVHTHIELHRLKRQAEERVIEMARFHEQLLQQEKMASIGQLAAGVAHEINNPMGFITSNLSTMGKYVSRITEFLAAVDRVVAESAAPAQEEVSALRARLKLDYIMNDTRQLLEESLDGATRVKNIVDDLKTMSRIDKQEMDHADLNKILETTLNVACNEIKYVADIVRQLGDVPTVRCHPQQLSQVFINLLTNAGHAIDGHGSITVRTWYESDSVFVSVSDSGRGIPEDIRSRIFEPFFTTKEVGKGTGLGLSISYDIVRKHGGEITVESEVGQGTTFIVRLPVDGSQGL